MKNVDIIEAFYKEMAAKNIAGLEKYLHPDVHFIGPVAQTKGKEAYLEAVRKFASFFTRLTIRSKFEQGDQAMCVYDVDFPAPIGHLPSAALMSFKEGKVAKIELFFDASAFKMKSS